MNMSRTHSDSRHAFRNHCEYACALDRPRTGRIRDALGWLAGIGLLAASFSAPYWITL
jgi:hypothetical protein